MKNIELLIPEYDKREYYITGDINANEYKDIKKFISSVISDDNEYAAYNTFKMKYHYNTDISFYKKELLPNVNIYLNSSGGYVYQGLGIYDSIKNLSEHCRVNMEGNGCIASMAVIIFLAAELQYRVCTKNTTFMIHQVSGMSLGTLKDQEENVKETKRLNDILFNIITENTNIDKVKLKEIYEKKQDWYISAEDALKYGIVSKII